MRSPTQKLLKKDTFGEVSRLERDGEIVIRRDIRPAAVWVRWLARRLMYREARALAALEGVSGVPQLIDVNRMTLERTFVDGQPMQQGKPTDPRYFKQAAKLLRKLHRCGVVHNDLAKEPNILLTADSGVAFIDFQLAGHVNSRTRLFRALAREDIRHLLKHKRTYCADALTTREKAILSQPGLLSRLWMQTVKPVYLFITRRLLGWSDREGAGDRGSVR
ncbi:MAG: RIO1 family regulatory kinase/ATPase [Woeseiaceae bacterium]|nr:RIO1 family regulatory kinase/ATPase [Woeseiaceae bacterium]